LTFTKDVRLLSQREFRRVVREGNRLVGRYLCIDYRRAPKLKLGISASGKYGSSPERNRFKRLVREAFRQSYSTLPPLELNVIPRQCAKKACCGDIADELVRLLKL
jgi:ribonuclease P protein component